VAAPTESIRGAIVEMSKAVPVPGPDNANPPAIVVESACETVSTFERPGSTLPPRTEFSAEELEIDIQRRRRLATIAAMKQARTLAVGHDPVDGGEAG
jgi:hypothetical protein